jgi:hypothetical protein
MKAFLSSVHEQASSVTLDKCRIHNSTDSSCRLKPARVKTAEDLVIHTPLTNSDQHTAQALKKISPHPDGRQHTLLTSSHRGNANSENLSQALSSTSWRRKKQASQKTAKQSNEQPASREKKDVRRTALGMENRDETKEKTQHHFRTTIR